jgi:fructose-bisphosphate aldolase/2-amino-3,7-dideoxy-D-threo-hept-6-ulosonate synthase
LETGKLLRIARILRPGTKRAVIIAVDHGNYAGAIKGLEDPTRAIKAAVNGGADAVIVNIGTLRKVCADVAGRVGIILRIDGGHTIMHPGKAQNSALTGTVELASRAGADAVVVMGYVGSQRETESLATLGQVASSCSQQGLALVAEMLPVDHLNKPAYTEEYVELAARVGSEIGADIIKTYYTGSSESFSRVVHGSVSPVVALGGPKMDSNERVLEIAEATVMAGGAGVAFGRNVWQSDNPEAMVRELVGIIHEGKSASEASSQLRDRR